MNNNHKTQGTTLTAGPMPVQHFTYANRPWSQQQRFIRNIACRSPVFYLTVFSLWALTIYWFHERLFGLMGSANGFVNTTSLLYFVIFTQIAWLYGIYNFTVVVFSSLVHRRREAEVDSGNSRAVACSNTPVAVLYLSLIHI